MTTTMKGLSLTILICLSLAGCSSMMNSGESAPIVTNGTVLASDTTVTTTTTTATNTANPNASNAAISGSVGGDVGKSFTDADAVKVNQALESNKTGQLSSWVDPKNNTTYSVTPTRTFASPTGEPCRDFTTTAAADGNNKQSYGTACRDSNGQWHVISS